LAIFAILCKQFKLACYSCNREFDDGNVFVESMEQINEIHVTGRVICHDNDFKFDFRRDESRREQHASAARSVSFPKEFPGR